MKLERLFWASLIVLAASMLFQQFDERKVRTERYLDSLTVAAADSGITHTGSGVVVLDSGPTLSRLRIEGAWIGMNGACNAYSDSIQVRFVMSNTSRESTSIAKIYLWRKP